LVWVAIGFNLWRFGGVGWGAHGLGCPQYPRVETRGYIDKTRLRGFGWWVGAIFFNVTYIQEFKPAQAGFVEGANGFQPVAFWCGGVFGAHGYPRVETRGYIDKTRLRGLGWWVRAIFLMLYIFRYLNPRRRVLFG